jgi:urease accessory protein UreE
VIVTLSHEEKAESREPNICFPKWKCSQGNLHGIHLQGLALTLRKIQGVLDQSQGPDLNLALDPEEVLEGIIQGHDHNLARVYRIPEQVLQPRLSQVPQPHHSPMSTVKSHVGNWANPDPNCCLGVFGLSLYTTESYLREVFSKYNPIC